MPVMTPSMPMTQPLRVRSFICALVCGVTVLTALSGCGKEPAKKQKMATVKLLPHTPPPPPPPPKPEEKKPEPPKEDKPQQQPDQPKPVEAPAPQALKSDEAAGDGPGNGMSAGSVSKDYQGGEIGSGTGGGDGGNRLAINAYANAVTRSLNDFLSRDKDVKRHDYKVQVHVWLEPDGHLLRAELVDTTGDAQADAALKAALARFPGLKTALPERMPQPMRLQVANRMIG